MSDEKISINESNHTIDKLASKEVVKLLNRSIDGFQHNFTKNISSHIKSALTNLVTHRVGYFAELIKYRDNYIVEGIYDILANDVILDVSSNQSAITVKVTDDEEVEEEIVKLFDKLNIVEVVQSILPDLFHYGSYPLRPIMRKGKGIVDLVDDLSPARVMPITDSKNNPLFYFVSDEDILLDKNLEAQVKNFKFSYFSIVDIVCFSLDLSFKKINLPVENAQNILNNPEIPDVAKRLLPQSLKIKTSRSFIWPALDKIKELIALDKVNIYNTLGRLLTPKLVGIPLPNQTSVDDAIEITSKYEDMLNSNLNNAIDISNLEFSLRENAGIKAIPIVGDRSELRAMDITGDYRAYDPEAFNNSLDTTLNSLGISPSLFRGEISGLESIKNNARYAKKIKRIQKNISRTLAYLALLHISEKFPQKNILIGNIKVHLRNNSNIDELENMETQDLMVSSLDNFNSVLGNLGDIVKQSDYVVDANAIVETVMDSLANSGSMFHTAFKKKDNNVKFSDDSTEESSEESDLDYIENTDEITDFEDTE